MIKQHYIKLNDEFSICLIRTLGTCQSFFKYKRLYHSEAVTVYFIINK